MNHCVSPINILDSTGRSTFHVSVGCSCHPAYWLRTLGLRTCSMPFDWLLGSPEYFMAYINNMIENRFADWLESLILNHRGKVISSLYEKVELFHHQALVNSDPRIVSCEIQKLQRRADRFLMALPEFNSYYFYYPLFKWRSHQSFINELSRFSLHAKGRIIVYYVSDISPEGIRELPEDASTFNSLVDQYVPMPLEIIAVHHRRDRRVHNIWGQEPDFLRPLSHFRLPSCASVEP
jgi:hypothetical protein